MVPTPEAQPSKPSGNGRAIPPPTAADALALLNNCTSLKSKQREDRIGAVRALIRICRSDLGGKKMNCDAVSKAAQAVPMDCEHINEHLFKHSPMRYGFSLRRFDNVVSLNRDVLRRLGQHAPELPRADEFLPAWQQLYALLSTERRKGMIAFMGYCTSEGIVPASVACETLLAFETWSVTRTLHRDPHGRARRIASSWNWAGRNITGWPNTRLALPSMRDDYTLPLDAYPVSFQQDIELYLKRLGYRSDDDLFPDNVAQPRLQGLRNRSPRSRRRPLTDRTLSTRRYQIRQAAAALVESGIAPESLRSLRDLVQPVERVRTILSFHRKRTLERQKLNDVGRTHS